MEFEFDPDKTGKNKEKHGIDFYEAQALWDDPDLIELPAKTADEARFIVMKDCRRALVRSDYVSGRCREDNLCTAIPQGGD